MSWKRLTKVDGSKIDENMDLVANVQIYEGGNHHKLESRPNLPFNGFSNGL